MSWFCSVCEKSLSRKDSIQRHMMSKHRNAGLTPFQTIPMPFKKCQRFRFEHPFTCMTAGMTGSGKTARVRSLLRQAARRERDVALLAFMFLTSTCTGTCTGS